jgi:AraC-like DNA-binding protein
MYPSVSLLADLAGELGTANQLPTFPSLLIDDPTLARAFLAAHRQSESQSGDAMRHDAVLGVLMMLVERHASGVNRAERGTQACSVRRAIQFVHDCHARRVTLDDIALAAGMSRFATLRAFRRVMRMSPYLYVTQVRVERARELLRAGVSIAAVSQRVGFADQSHLNRHFKRFTGVTPGEYARAFRVSQSRRATSA